MTLDEVEQAHVKAAARKSIPWQCRFGWHAWGKYVLLGAAEIHGSKSGLVAINHWFRRTCGSCGKTSGYCERQRIL